MHFIYIGGAIIVIPIQLAPQGFAKRRLKMRYTGLLLPL